MGDAKEKAGEAGEEVALVVAAPEVAADPTVLVSAAEDACVLRPKPSEGSVKLATGSTKLVGRSTTSTYKQQRTKFTSTGKEIKSVRE